MTEIVLNRAKLIAAIEELGVHYPGEMRIVRLHYGLEGGKNHGQDEIAQICNRSRERIRRVDVNARRRFGIKLGLCGPMSKTLMHKLLKAEIAPRL